MCISQTVTNALGVPGSLCASPDVFLCSSSPAYSTPGATAPNRFVGIGSRDNNFLNIPQQTQVGVWDLYSEGVCVSCLKGGLGLCFYFDYGTKSGNLLPCVCMPKYSLYCLKSVTGFFFHLSSLLSSHSTSAA